MTKFETIAMPACATPQYASRTDRPAPRVADDATMLRIAAELNREFSVASPTVYWADFLASTVIGYAGLAGAILLDSPAMMVACGLLAMLALYRAASFIHELTHIRKGALPGFRAGWNILIGVPLMIPSSCMKACTRCIMPARAMVRRTIRNIYRWR